MLQWAPEIGEPASRGYDAFLKVFDNLPSVSIDYAVLEKSSKAAMVALEAGWSDVGSWDALYEIRKKDGQGNVLSGDAMAFGSSNTLLFSEERLLVGVDLENLLVVDSADALFVAPRGSSQKVREVVAALKLLGRKETSEAPEVVRPWGRYRIIFAGERFKIKHIVVDPGKRLSLQYHLRRSEHWVVVQGSATVAMNGSRLTISEGGEHLHSHGYFSPPRKPGGPPSRTHRSSDRRISLRRRYSPAAGRLLQRQLNFRYHQFPRSPAALRGNSTPSISFFPFRPFQLFFQNKLSLK